jgi:basic amino acid/polyamine antiporter, APA family
MYAFGAMLSFTIAHLAVIRLRTKEPDHRRPFKGPGNVRLFGYDIPLFAVFGGLGTGLAWIVVTFLYPPVAAAGAVWLSLGMIIYVVFRRRQGLDLTTTVTVAVTRPVLDTEAEYEAVLVVLDAQRYMPAVVATAAKVAARRKRGIHILVPIVVPASSPIGAAMPELELAAQALVEQAKLQAGRRVTGHWEKVRAGGAGRMIIDEALEIQAKAIVMGLPARGGASVFGKTVEAVLAERPCRVILQTGPEPGSEQEPAAAAA